MGTSPRIAEASALQWKHVDLPSATVKIRRNLVRGEGGKLIFKATKTEGSTRDIKLPEFVLEALREQRKRTWKGDRDHLVFVNKAGGPLHPHSLNNTVIRPVLKRLGINSSITVKDTRATYITNSLDQNERMSFVQHQVEHTTTRMIVDHYYRHVPAPDDGSRLESAWNSTRLLPDRRRASEQELEMIE
jgi:integrase